MMPKLSEAAAWQGLDIARVVSGVTQYVAQPPDGRVEAVLEIDERIVGPQALAKLVAGDQLMWAVQKGEEEPERLLRQNDVCAVGVQLARAGIQLEGNQTARDRAGRRAESSPGSASQGLTLPEVAPAECFTRVSPVQQAR